MGYILPAFYHAIASERLKRPCPEIFVETGTFKGGTALTTLRQVGNLNDFSHWHTVELGESIARIASNRFKQIEKKGEFYEQILSDDTEDLDFVDKGVYFDGKLTLYKNDSTVFLAEFLKDRSDSMCFWLDAHAGADKYARGEQDVPLLKELELIFETSQENDLIGIDDAHLFGTNQNGKCDYTNVTINAIKELSNSYGYSVYASQPYNMELLIIFQE
jgi:hypothetical protein